MTKYAIYTKWYWKDGIASQEDMQNGMKENLVGKTEAEDVIWWKMNDHHHQSVIIFSSEEDAKAELEMRQKQRAQSINETGHKMIEETMGPVLSIMSEA